MSLPWNASQARVTRRDLIKRGLVTAAGLLLAKTMSASAEAPAVPGARRTPVERPKPASWRTRVRIIEK
jgi:hypothetical protein